MLELWIAYQLVLSLKQPRQEQQIARCQGMRGFPHIWESILRVPMILLLESMGIFSVEGMSSNSSETRDTSILSDPLTPNEVGEELASLT